MTDESPLAPRPLLSAELAHGFEGHWARVRRGNPGLAHDAFARALAETAWDAATRAEREACGEIANKKAAEVLATNTYHGRTSAAASFAASMLEDVGLSIRMRATPQAAQFNTAGEAPVRAES
jgi:hypothetical protein